MKYSVLGVLVVTAVVLGGGPAPVLATQGNSFALSAGAGVQGLFSMFEAGVQLPKFNGRFGFGLKARYLSSLTYATYIDSAEDYISFHPCVVGGALTMGGCSPAYRDLLRAYGNFEILLGHSFTPWDDVVARTGNLFGENLTSLASGYFGLEVFTSRRTGVYLEAGGGFKSISGDEENRYVQTSAWLGSGATLRMGVNVYL